MIPIIFDWNYLNMTKVEVSVLKTKKETLTYLTTILTCLEVCVIW